MWKYWQKDEGIYYHYDGKGHLSCTYCTPKHPTNNEKNIETHFAYEDGDSDYGYMDATHFDIVIFFAKANGSIDHLIDYESVKFFFCLIMWDIDVSIIYSTTNIFEDSRRAIILLLRSWIETY